MSDQHENESTIRVLVGRHQWKEPGPRRSVEAVSKYNPLLQYLARSDALYLKFSLTEIEKILGAPLPQSARRYSAWWANNQDGGHVQAASWLDVGYHTENLDLNAGTVSFRKAG